MQESVGNDAGDYEDAGNTDDTDNTDNTDGTWDQTGVHYSCTDNFKGNSNKGLGCTARVIAEGYKLITSFIVLYIKRGGSKYSAPFWVKLHICATILTWN